MTNGVNATLPEVEVTAKRESTRLPCRRFDRQQQALAARTSALPCRARPGSASAIDVGGSASSKTQQGKSISLSDFRIVFEVEQNFTHLPPWKLIATIYNVPPKLVKQIVEQYTNVALTAGYMLPQSKQELDRHHLA